jgi:molecular chaperone IbpA
MRNLDLTPLFHSTVGFDRLNRMLNAVSRVDDRAPSYPPYDIEKIGDDAYRISMAVAGFAEGDIELTQHDNTLSIKGATPKPEADKADAKLLHRGIARRGFERTFELADYIRVTGATLENGLLHVELVREVPEEMKPRRIEIQRGDVLEHKGDVLEHKKAA